MAVEAVAKGVMTTAIKDAATLTLQAWTLADPTSTLISGASATPTFAASVVGSTSAYTQLSADVILTIPTDTTVGFVKLYSTATLYASEALVANNVFPNGGDLIVTGFKIKVE